MLNENESTIADAAGPIGPESPVESPVRVPRLSAGPTYVYAIQCGDWIKIGMAFDTVARMADLQAACPYPLKLVARRQFPSREVAKSMERACHQILRRQRHQGEWFRIEGTDHPIEVLLDLYRDEAKRQKWELPRDPIDPREPNYQLQQERGGRLIGTRDGFTVLA